MSHGVSFVFLLVFTPRSVFNSVLVCVVRFEV
jgi:hypothetical protein